MEGDVIARSDLTELKNYLRDGERPVRTINKYYRDVAASMGYAGASQCVTKEVVIGCKRHLQETYKITSANSMLAALNYSFHFKGWDDHRVGLPKVQRQLIGSEDRKLTKEEYKRLIKVAWSSENKRLAMIMETTGNTGICASELSFITVEPLYTGRVEMYNKGRCRMIFIIKELYRLLLEHCRERNLSSGSAFVTSGGMQMSRSNIRSEMKKLCTKARIPKQKVFLHNLKHLFAYTYYGIDKDLVHLAGILGHLNVEAIRIYMVSIEEEQGVAMRKMKMTT